MRVWARMSCHNSHSDQEGSRTSSNLMEASGLMEMGPRHDSVLFVILTESNKRRRIMSRVKSDDEKCFVDLQPTSNRNR